MKIEIEIHKCARIDSVLWLNLYVYDFWGLTIAEMVLDLVLTCAMSPDPLIIKYNIDLSKI